MGKNLYEARSEARKIFEIGEEVTGLPLRDWAFSGPEEALQRTENLQPALTAVNLAVWAVLEAEGLHPAFLAGHSLGEFSALCAAGVLTLEETFQLVKRRGELMSRAGEIAPGAMYAVIGLERSRLEEILSRISGRVYLANHNSPEQSVISGEEPGVHQAAQEARAAGARRVVRLPVSGAFHCPLMEPAAREFAKDLQKVTFRPARIPVVPNATAAPATDPEVLRRALERQMLSAVRWVESVEAMVQAGVELFVEAGPKKVLSGLMRRIAPQIPVISVESLEEIQALL